MASRVAFATLAMLAFSAGDRVQAQSPVGIAFVEAVEGSCDPSFDELPIECAALRLWDPRGAETDVQ